MTSPISNGLNYFDFFFFEWYHYEIYLKTFGREAIVLKTPDRIKFVILPTYVIRPLEQKKTHISN
jgi:hypothetical protein